MSFAFFFRVEDGSLPLWVDEEAITTTSLSKWWTQQCCSRSLSYISLSLCPTKLPPQIVSISTRRRLPSTTIMIRIMNRIRRLILRKVTITDFREVHIPTLIDGKKMWLEDGISSHKKLWARPKRPQLWLEEWPTSLTQRETIFFLCWVTILQQVLNTTFVKYVHTYLST